MNANTPPFEPSLEQLAHSAGARRETASTLLDAASLLDGSHHIRDAAELAKLKNYLARDLRSIAKMLCETALTRLHVAEENDNAICTTHPH